MRIYQSGAEGGAVSYEASSGFGVGVSTTQKIGQGSAYSYVIGSPNVSGKIDTGVGYSLNLPNTSSLSDYYYKSDIYIDNLSAVGNGLTFMALNTGGTPDQVQILIYNDSGTLKMVAQYNTDNYWYDGSAAHSSVVNLGVAFDTWFRFEVHVDTTAGAGACIMQVKVNGNTLINETALTFTAPTSNAMTVGVSNLTGTDALDAIIYVDNISVNSSSGTYNNTWIGEEYITILRPSDFGDELSGTGGITSISELPVTTTSSTSSGTSNIVMNTSGALAVTVTDPLTGVGTYTGGTGGTMPTDAVVKAITTPTYIRESAAGTSNYRTYLRSNTGGTRFNTTSSDAGDTTVRTSPNSTTNFGRLLLSETDPTTGARWKVTGTNSLTNMQIGVERVSGSANILVQAMNAMVAYSPYVAPTSHGMLIMFW